MFLNIYETEKWTVNRIDHTSLCHNNNANSNMFKTKRKLQIPIRTEKQLFFEKEEELL